MVRRLLLLNGLAAIAAVAHHAIHWVLVAMVWWADRYRPVTIPNFDLIGGWSFYGFRVIDQIALVGVPSFLFVSGFFIANATDKSQNTIGWRIIFNRIRIILIPYILWVSLLLVADIIEGEKYSAIGIVKLFLTGKVAPPYYYVPLLVQLFLLSLVLVPLVRDRFKLSLWIVFLLQIPVITFTYIRLLAGDVPQLSMYFLVFTDWHLPGYLMWFVIGMVAGFQKQAFKNFVNRYRRLFNILLAVTFVAGIVEWELLRRGYGHEWLSPQITLIDKAYTIFFLLSFFAIENLKVPFAKVLDKLGLLSFGIYLIHAPVLEYTSRLIYHFAPSILSLNGLFFIILVVAGVSLPVILINLVDRSPARILHDYIFG